MIFDSPSLDRCNDALLLEPSVDGLILVTRPGITQKNLLSTTIDEFLDAELPLIGVVINEVESLGVRINSSNFDNNGNGSGSGSTLPIDDVQDVEEATRERLF